MITTIILCINFIFSYFSEEGFVRGVGVLFWLGVLLCIISIFLFTWLTADIGTENYIATTHQQKIWITTTGIISFIAGIILLLFIYTIMKMQGLNGIFPFLAYDFLLFYYLYGVVRFFRKQRRLE